MSSPTNLIGLGMESLLAQEVANMATGYLTNNEYLKGRNAAGTDDVNILKVNASDVIVIGDNNDNPITVDADTTFAAEAIFTGAVTFEDTITQEAEVTFEDNLVVEGYVSGTVTATATAAGVDITDALDLTTSYNNITTVASGTGVQLPAAPLGSPIIVRNSGANALLVYPDTALIKINGGTDGAAVSVAATEVAIFVKVSATNWIGGVAVAF